jgi:uncharacterized protein
MVPPIAVEPREWAELAAILRNCVPGRAAWAFGSRATRRGVRRFSDLDLVIGGEALTLGEEVRLEEAFDESLLPFKVDFAQLARLAPDFRARIEPEMVVVQKLDEAA